MKRITRISIARVLPVLAIIVASLSTGCTAETSTSTGTDESSIVSDRAHDVANGDVDNAEYRGGPAKALELKTRLDEEGQGPHPEPWLDQQGPHPEPWQTKNVTFVPDTDPNTNGGTKKP